MILLTNSHKRAILIVGPTASGKSSLAIALAQQLDGVIINADALQVYENWQVLTARPSTQELQLAPHKLYGHVEKDVHYSVGAWIKDVSEVLDNTSKLPILTGGTGLYFRALTNGLSRIPPIPPEIRVQGDKFRIEHGAPWFREALQADDPETLATLDENNPARLQRAWEVLSATGKGLTYWHAQPAPPLISLEDTIPIVLNWNTNQLNQRIDQRFDLMMSNGALDECKANLAAGFDPTLPSSRALGAKEIIDALQGKTTLQEAVMKSKTLTHQFAKRQRTWFRSKMKNWHQIEMPAAPDVANRIIADFL